MLPRCEGARRLLVSGGAMGGISTTVSSGHPQVLLVRFAAARSTYGGLPREDDIECNRHSLEIYDDNRQNRARHGAGTGASNLSAGGISPLKRQLAGPATRLNSCCDFD